MKNILIVFERPDLAAAATIQAQHTVHETWVFDPHLLDDLASSGILNGRYIELPTGYDLPKLHLTLDHEIAAIETALGDAMEPVLGYCPRHWNYLNWHCQLWNLWGYTQLWDTLLTSDLGGHHFLIPIYDRPALFYAPSYFPPILLLERLAANGVSFSAFSHSSIEEIPIYLPAILPDQNDPAECWIHLPTCIYDRAYFAAELAASGRRILNFPSANWNVPFPDFPQASLVLDNDLFLHFDPALRSRIDKVCEHFDTILTDAFLRYLKTTPYVIRQVAYLRRLYRAQMIFLIWLESRYSDRVPQKIVLSNHDAGIHGPLLSFAQRRAIDVIMLPHAKIFNWSVASLYDQIIAPTHAMQGGQIATINGAHLLAPTLNFPQDLLSSHRPPAPLASIGVIINKFSSDGMTFVDSATYLAGLCALRDWCTAATVRFSIRIKPGGTCLVWLSEGLAMQHEDILSSSGGTISDFATSVDLCIMYDAPTSGAADILRQSVPLLSTLPRTLPPTESRVVSSELVPQLNIAETFVRLDEFVRNPLALSRFRRRQFADYAMRVSRGVPLRQLL